MAQTNINIRIDENLKKQFDSLCTDIGMSMTTAFCIFAKTAVRERRIPFELRADIPNQDTIQSIDNIINKAELSKGFTSAAELMEDLNADD